MKCQECGKEIYHEQYKLCKQCTSDQFRDNFKNWTSGDANIDELIQNSQLNAVYDFQLIEWIEYQNLEIIEHVADGGFGSVYKAIWKGGPIKSASLNNPWDIQQSEWKRDGDTEVAIKKFRNATKMTIEYLNEVKKLNNFSK